MLTELRRLVIASAILRQSDATWPKGTKEGGQQKLEVTVGEDSIALQTCRPHPSNTADPDGLNAFFYLVEDVKTFTFSLLEFNAGERGGGRVAREGYLVGHGGGIPKTHFFISG